MLKNGDKRTDIHLKNALLGNSYLCSFYISHPYQTELEQIWKPFFEADFEAAFNFSVLVRRILAQLLET